MALIIFFFSSAPAAEKIIETDNGDLDFVEIGYVSDVLGLQESLTFVAGKRWLRQQFSGRDEILEVELVAGRGHPGSKSWIVKLSGFDTIDEARQLVGSTFLVRNIDRPELQEGEFYSRDLVGMKVTLKETGEAVGTVANVFNNGGNDLLHVLLEASFGSPDGSLKQKSLEPESGHLVWIPFVEPIVPDVDMDKRELQITPPKGLFEVESANGEKERSIKGALFLQKKKLCELEQQHIFHGLRYGEKSQRNLLAEQITDVNSNLLQQALQAAEKPINGIAGLEPATIRLKANAGAALYEVRTAEQVKKTCAQAPNPYFVLLAKALLNKDLSFLVKGCLFPLIEDSIYKRRSTEDTKIALTDTIYEKNAWSKVQSRWQVFVLAPEREQEIGDAPSLLLYILYILSDSAETMSRCNIEEAIQNDPAWKYCSSLKISEKYLTSTTKEELALYSEHVKHGERLISEGKFATIIALNRSYPEKHLEFNNEDFKNGNMSTSDHLVSVLSDEQTLMQVKFLKEEKLPVVSSSADGQKNKVLMKSPWVIHQSPVGLGGTICGLSSNNILDDLIKAGVEYIEVTQSYA
ncbi:Ribosome maturation factor RimM [Bienertia sinuspersici]